MEIRLYNTSDEDVVINKTIELKYTLDIDLKNVTNISQPMIKLYEPEDMNFRIINYMYLPHFDRYYFVRSINIAPNKMYEFLLECDVLYTYKDKILDSEAEISRSIKEGDYGQSSSRTQVIKEVDIIESDFNVLYSPSIILTTIGGME